MIVPGRDIAKYAPDAIASLKAQTEPRWRAILVDDGSLDATGQIFADAAANDPRFTVLSHHEALGASVARNRALDLVNTPYLGFLDGDDELTPRALERMLGTVQETGSDFVVAAYVRSRLVDGSYVPGRVQPWVAASTSPERLRTDLSEHPKATGNIVSCSKISRTEFWAGRRFPEGVAYEDQRVAQEMYVQASSFDVIPDVVVLWRLRAEGTSITQNTASLGVLRDYLAALRSGIDVLRDAGFEDATTARIELILSMDVPPLISNAAEHPDPAYSLALGAFLTEVLAMPEAAAARPDETLRDALAW